MVQYTVMKKSTPNYDNVIEQTQNPSLLHSRER